jgi:MFS family permease
MVARSSRTLRRDLIAIHTDGAAFSVMVGIGETYVAAFALALGLGDVVAGLIASMPLLAGAVLQLVSPLAVRRISSYRRWVVLCARIQALMFLPLAASAVLGSISVAALFAVVTLYWGAGMATGPAWNAWVGDLVPARLRSSFFARRARISQATLLAGLLAGGWILHEGEARDARLLGFAAIFALAGLFRGVSSAALASQSEAPGATRALAHVGVAELWRRARRSSDGRLLVYMLAVQVAVHISAAYFTPYMLGPLGLSYVSYVVLIAASFVAKIALLPMLGSISRRFGARALLVLGGIGIVPLSSLWVISDWYPYLLAVQVVAGTSWAAWELATFLLFFETIRAEERTSVLTLFNLASAIAMAAGAVVGGTILHRIGTVQSSYWILFLISSGLRLATLPLLLRIPAVTIVEQVMPATGPIAARPSAGTFERPVLPSLESEEEGA